MICCGCVTRYTGENTGWPPCASDNGSFKVVFWSFSARLTLLDSILILLRRWQHIEYLIRDLGEMVSHFLAFFDCSAVLSFSNQLCYFNSVPPPLIMLSTFPLCFRWSCQPLSSLSPFLWPSPVKRKVIDLLPQQVCFLVRVRQYNWSWLCY